MDSRPPPGLKSTEFGVRDPLRRGDAEATAHLVLAALIEAALLIATADDPAAMRARVEPGFRAMLGGLRAD